MGLNVWTETTAIKTIFQRSTTNWTVELQRGIQISNKESNEKSDQQRDHSSITIHPKYIIQATGASGKPRECEDISEHDSLPLRYVCSM